MLEKLVLALLLLIATASAENYILGEYSISFEMNDFDQTIRIGETQYSETYTGVPVVGYPLEINNSKYYASILITQFNSTMYTKNEDDIHAANHHLDKFLNNSYSRAYDRIIDGHNASLWFYELPPNDIFSGNVFLATYWIDEADDFGNTTCFIFSAYPWDEGTLDLLKTIHIEKVKKITQ